MAYSLSGERPVHAALPAHPLAATLRWLGKVTVEFRRRRQLEQLLELDQHRLWDLGISRADIANALHSSNYDLDAARDWRRSLDVWPPR